ncbi:MAG: BtpA/SgcQ family protein [Synechococcus sp. SB0662_bin_45]|nr:BtpA/SgcQ family protein [Synechococcus sp. SB0668_bin_13]MXX08439.1 BtpA/SgcQ family protein [Synechococcus sp. SB0667_bin_8]MYE21846.1 BtpA/SgcQ family protein [Synechococcus sp. SB0662_bin_45]MYG63610.1 BtpA/SgcQ family protein [Synechococcus sp. SB0675_bin_7]MYI72341.1 BtpA/SgcQ family protein [Synechococcus sp. SB0673_bin_10]MYK86477.1 BtpA/SgcQ family protein [Synechococcus sp. SB0669_bin_7]
MKTLRWRQLFGDQRPLIGVVHLPPLPGAPGWGGDMDAVEAWALADARAYASGGAAAVLVENFGDHPFFPHQAPPETVAAMGRIATAVVRAVPLPVGINVLRNDGAAAMAVAVASGARFIRVNVLSGAMVTDQGLIQGCAAQLLRQRRLLAADDVAVLADVLVKHALPLTPLPVGIAVQDTLERGGADGVIVSGDSTGTPVDPEILHQARHAAKGAPVLIGSGFGPATADHLGPLCDGVIVASALKRDGQLCNPVDPQRVAQLQGRFHP